MFLFAFFILLGFALTENSKIVDLTDSDFDLFIKSGEVEPWIVMFYVKECTYCKAGNEILQKIRNNLEKEEKSMKIGRLECNENMYACLRFNITKVPTVFIIEKGYYFEEGSHLTEGGLLNFAKAERELEKGILLPPSFGLIQFVMRSLEETMTQLNAYMGQLTNSTFGTKIKWGNIHSIILFSIVFVLVFVIEFYLLTYCLKKKKTVENKGQPGEEKKDVKAETSDAAGKEKTDESDTKVKKEQ